MANTENLQDLILNEVRREHMPVTLFLMNGFQLKGIVTGFDSFTVILSTRSPRSFPCSRCISADKRPAALHF